MSIARKSALGFVGQVYMLAIGLLSTIIVARLLGPEGKGVLAIVSAIPALALGVASFGLGPSLAYMSGKDRYPARDLASSAIAWSLLLGLALGVLVWLCRGVLLSSVLKGLGSFELIVVLASLPAFYLSAFLGALFIGHDRAVEFAGLQAVSATLNFIAVVGASVFYTRNATAMVLALGVASLLAALYGLVAYRASLTLSPRRIAAVTKEAIPYAAKSYVGQATTMFFLRADVFFLNYFAGPAAVGVYSVATNLAEKLWLLSNPVSSAIYSQITGSDREDALRITTLTGRALLVLNGLAAVALALIAIPLVPLIYGSQFASATTYLALLLPGVVAYAMCQPYIHFFAGQLGRPAVTSALSAVMMALSAALYLWLIPIMGPAGAAVGSTLSYSVALIGYAWLLPRATGISVREMLVPSRTDWELYRSVAASMLRRMRHRGAASASEE
ncbi:MAG: oligosaccharide flippase family protein [Coriobacteriia bacterium]|nr:oligosaccharide flippase family protein [Coriobacteriia bacterium]